MKIEWPQLRQLGTGRPANRGGLLHANLPRFKVAAVGAFEGVQVEVGLLRSLDADQAIFHLAPRAWRQRVVLRVRFFCHLSCQQIQLLIVSRANRREIQTGPARPETSQHLRRPTGSGSPARSVPRASTGSGSCFRSSATTLGFRLLQLHRPFWRSDLPGDDIVRYRSSGSLSVIRRERDRSLSHRRLGRAAVGDGDQRTTVCRVPHKRENRPPRVQTRPLRSETGSTGGQDPARTA